MPVVHFVTHPEVVVDPAVAVPDWELSPAGLRRMRLAVERPWAAGVLAKRLGLETVAIAELGENDRSATGYLPKAEFEAVADAFFGRPEESVRGWERAVDAQRRIVLAVDHVLSVAAGQGDVAIVSHGAVGALLLCHLTGRPISRSADQPAGGGGYFYSFDAVDRRVVSGWRRIED